MRSLRVRRPWAGARRRSGWVAVFAALSLLLSPTVAIADPVSDPFTAPASAPVMEAGSISAVTASFCFRQAASFG